MKKINLLLVAVIGAISLTLTSCDECKDVTCENGGTCSEGVCTCPDGFSGDACETEDKCITNNVTCENDGTCDDGVCACATGYEGDMCEIGWSAKFIAKYSVSDGCGATYDSEISSSSTDGHINIVLSDFGINLCNNEPVSVDATLSGSSDITIAKQTFCDGPTSAFTVEGTGSINEAGNVVTITYSGTEQGGAVSYSCTATMTKK